MPARPSAGRLAGGAVVLGLLLWSMRLGAAEAHKPVRHTVTIDATSYLPKTTTVAVGDTVVWVNKDILKHTVTARDGGFDSKDIPPGSSWAFTVRSEGLFAYACVYHTTMKGTLRVR